MSATLTLLDKYKAARGIPSDNAAAIALGIHRATVSGWRRGGKQAEPHVVADMAKAVGEGAGGWLALIESERARSEADRKTWAAVAKQLGAAAVLAFAALLPGFAQASALQPEQSQVICIMRNRGRWNLARALRSFVTSITDRCHGPSPVLA